MAGLLALAGPKLLACACYNGAMAKLTWRQRNGQTRDFLVGERATVGREFELDCVLDTKGVSRRHACIERRANEFFISDLGSTNGTRVNGSLITELTLLSPGDTIQLGDELLEFDPEQGAGTLTGGSLVTEPIQRSGRSGHAQRAFNFPQRVGKFQLLKKLGQGGMGAVFQAMDHDSGREVAVKFIRSNIGRREAFLDFWQPVF